MRLQTRRLELIAGTVALLDAELAGRAALEQALGIDVPHEWPPELYDRPAMEYSLKQLRDPAAAGWSLWYLISTETKRAVAAGIAGFKGKPTEDGTVEVGYSVLGAFQRRGYATEAVGALVEWAFRQDAVRRVVAETFPHLTASIRVMEKNGFHLLGPGSEAGTLRYELLRHD